MRSLKSTEDSPRSSMLRLDTEKSRLTEEEMNERLLRKENKIT